MSLRAFIKSLIPEGMRPKSFRPWLIEAIMRDGIIKGGPFQGMIFPTCSPWSGLLSKLLGVYETELTPTLHAWKKIPFSTIINIGSADGYHALGCAKIWPEAQIIAYETEEVGRKTLQEYSLRNGVEGRVHIRQTCTPWEFQCVLKEVKSGLVIMDVEGDEARLLVDEHIPLLQSFYLIVEIHDLKVDQLGDHLMERFSATHRISERWTHQRRLEDFSFPENPLIRIYLLEQLREIANEERGAPMRWLVFEPRQG